MSRFRTVATSTLVAAIATSALVAAVTVGTLAAPAAGQFEQGEPDLSVYLEDDEVVPGGETTLEFQVENTGELHTGVGEQVLTARGVTVEITDDGPFEARSGETPIGPVADGQIVPAPQRIAVPTDLEPGEYEITLTVRYAYTSQVSSTANLAERHTTSETVDVTIVVPDEPRFDVTTLHTDVEPGASGEATFEVTNAGTEPANETRVTITGGSGVLIGDGSAAEVIGDLGPGETKTVTVGAAVDAAASDGPKPVTVEFTYRDGSGIERHVSPEAAILAPGATQSFAIDDLEGRLAVGQNGEITGELRNDGPRTVDDAVLVLEPGSQSLAVEDTRYALPVLEPGESAAFRYAVDVSPTADDGPRQLGFTVEYGSGDAIVESDRFTARVTVDPENAFSIVDLEDTLAVGYDGEITGELRNDGPLAVDDAVLVVEPMSDSLHVEDTRYALPELAPGESAAFRYPTDVSGSADDGPRQVRFTVEYTGAGATTLSSDPISERVVVDPRQDEFSIEGIETTVTAGESTDLVLEVTNERPETLSNIDAMLYTDRPLDSGANEAFVPELAPGESAVISFDLSAADDARETTYPVELDFEYRTERGETTLSAVYQVPVEIGANDEPEESRSISPLAVSGLGALAVAGIGVGLWFRRS